MAKLKIVKVVDNKYFLKDINNKLSYNFTLYFYGLDKKPSVNDIIDMHSSLLDVNYEEYCTTYRFGPLEEKYGRNIKNSKDVDCIMLIANNEKIFLKRFYG